MPDVHTLLLFMLLLIVQQIIVHVQDVETVVGDISRAIQQHKNLSYVSLKDCCEELTRGVVDGVSESDGPLSLSVDTRRDYAGYGRIEFKEQLLHVKGIAATKVTAAT